MPRRHSDRYMITDPGEGSESYLCLLLKRNKASGRVLEKSGMRYEGTIRQHIINAGRYEDIAVHGCYRRITAPLSLLENG